MPRPGDWGQRQGNSSAARPSFLPTLSAAPLYIAITMLSSAVVVWAELLMSSWVQLRHSHTRRGWFTLTACSPHTLSPSQLVPFPSQWSPLHLPALYLHMRENMWLLFFGVCLISQNMVTSVFIHFPADDTVLFFWMVEWLSHGPLFLPLHLLTGILLIHYWFISSGWPLLYKFLELSFSTRLFKPFIFHFYDCNVSFPLKMPLSWYLVRY